MSWFSSAIGDIGGALKGVVSNPITEGALGFIPGVGPALQGVASFLGGNGGRNALGAAEGINSALLQSKANDYAKQALGTAQQSYNERAPLRTAGIAGMLNPSAGIAPKIAALTANSSNPFTIKMPQTPTIGPAGS